ncbi:MAG: hypothetical protein GXP50_05075 [Deltaproteobacteria bacterium]|nr:hypothetical protein [Deltaproteobacteria bacterium]
MKCPKCGYISFDYLDECRRCGTDLRDARALLGLIVVRPEDRVRLPVGPPEEEPTEGEGFVSPGEEIEAADLSPGGEADEGEDLLADLDFEESFEDVVERTHYEEVEQQEAAGEEDDGLLDLDFGDLFADENKDS